MTVVLRTRQRGARRWITSGSAPGDLPAPRGGPQVALQDALQAAMAPPERAPG
jgi:hypothetical protein